MWRVRNKAFRVSSHTSDDDGISQWIPFRRYSGLSTKSQKSHRHRRRDEEKELDNAEGSPHPLTHEVHQDNNSLPNSPTSQIDFAATNGDSPDAIKGANGTDDTANSTGNAAHHHHLPFSRRKTGSKDGAKESSERRSSDGSFEPPPKITVGSQIKAVMFSWVNILLVCVPIGIALHFVNVSGVAKFVVNFIAIIPLAGLLSYATEELALRVGETLGGLLNASFGNAVELIIAIIALAHDEIVIVKTSLIGSMLSNLLLVMGMCFFFGGLGKLEQFFNTTVAQTAASLLALAVGALLIPTFFDQGSNNSGPDALRTARVPELSRGVAVILLFVYACYLTFQLRTHTKIFSESGDKASVDEEKQKRKVESGSIRRGIIGMGGLGASATVGGNVSQQNLDAMKNEPEEEEEQPKLTLWGAIITLIISTALVGVTSEFMVDGIGSIVETGHVSAEFIGLILIPIVGNAAEHATAVTVAIKDKMDLAIGVAIGSSLQIALFVLPVSVIVGWGIASQHADWTVDQIMTLEFEVFQIGLLFVAIILVNYLIQDGASNWLEGVLLMSTYIMIAVAAWFYPADAAEVVG